MYFITETYPNFPRNLKVNVNFWRIDSAGNEESLNGDQRDSTNKIIQQYLGTYDDFVLTALSLQNNNTGFIDKSQRERKELLSQFLDIDIFEQQYAIGHEDSKETAALIREYKRKDFSTDLVNANEIITQFTGSYEQMKIDKSEHEEMKTNLNVIIFSLTNYEITQLTDDLGNLRLDRDRQKEMIKSQKKLIKETNQKINKVDEKELNLKLSELQKNESVIIKLSNDLKVKELEIQHAQKMVSKLDKHEWDPNCKYCMANPWLHETKQVADLLPKLKDKYMYILQCQWLL